jgi:hypothetical protein
MWLAIPVALFLALAWFGGEVRRGRIKPGPWFKQFRVVRGGFAFLTLIAAGAMLARNMWPAGIAFLIVSLLLSGTVRFSSRAYYGDAPPRGPRAPDLAGAYTADEIRAYQTLGLSIGADKKAVKEAWKRLMKSAHPDQGGDAKRASALNAARDILLKRRN